MQKQRMSHRMQNDACETNSTRKTELPEKVEQNQRSQSPLSKLYQKLLKKLNAEQYIYTLTDAGSSLTSLGYV